MRWGRVVSAMGLLFLFCALARPARAATPPMPTAGAASATAQSASQASPAALAREQLANLDTSTISRFIDEAGQAIPGAGFSWASLGQFLHGQGVLTHPERLFGALGNLFVGEVRGNLGLLARLLVLVVLSGILRQLHGAFEGEAIGRVADAAIFLALGLICLAGFRSAVGMARGAVQNLGSFMLALLPALVGLLAATGSVASAGLIHPALVAAVTAVGLLVQAVIVPLVVLAAVLDIVSAFSPEFRLTRLAGLIRQVGLGLLGLASTVFLGVVAVEGITGSVADGLALRTGKYAVKTLIPVVGGMLADTAELVLTSGLLLRSGLGLVGLVATALLVVVPLLKLLALALIYRGAAALAQPVGGDGVAAVLGGVGSAVVLLGAAVTVVGLMWFLSLAVLVGAGGAALAGR